MASAREIAVQALMAHRKRGAWSEIVLHNLIEKAGLSGRDTALAGKICFGVLQNRSLLDFYLSQFCHTPVEKLEPKILDILRVAVYQMVFLTRIPSRAAVDEAVKMAKRTSPKAAGLVNAVLRRVSERLEDLPEPPRDDLISYLTIKYSHPRWLVERFAEILGEPGAEALLAANNADVPVYAQVNTLRTDVDQVEGALIEQDVQVRRHPWLADCLILTNTGPLEGLKPFRDGNMYIQDPAARLAVLAANPQSGTRVWDACAAPGGKSFAAAIHMGNKGELIASDIQEKKLARIEFGAARLGISILTTRTADARTADMGDMAPFDTVLADVPCSGLGIIRKKPEIRDKTAQEIARLPEIQLDILKGAARWVAPGGILLYATCTILPEENGGVIGAFLAETKEFVWEAFSLPGEIGVVPEGQITLYPHIHGTDGFFLCKLRRVA